MAERRKSQDAFPRASPLPQLPAGLTIEKKKPGRKPLDANYHVASSGNIIDRVEITKIPVSGVNGTASSASPKGDDDAPLNLSMKSGGEEDDQPLSLTKNDKEKDLMSSYYSSAAAKIPSEYYACKLGELP